MRTLVALAALLLSACFCPVDGPCPGAAMPDLFTTCGAAGQPCCYGGDAGTWGACMAGLECGGGAPATCL